MQKIKYKHNKKRNTAFLFEALVKELTKAVVYGDKQKQKLISNTIKEHFKKSTVLEKELSLYKQIYETKEFPENVADKLINQLKSEHEKLNEQEVFNEQSKLIGKINKQIGTQVYDNFVPNYKTLATISQIFNRSVEAKQKVLLEQELKENITKANPEKKVLLETVDSLTFKRFVDRFNEEYNGKLLSEQKKLLGYFINSSENDVGFKVFVNEELERLKESIDNALTKYKDQQITDKLKAVNKNIEKMKIETINEELVKKIMYIQEFVAEVNK